MQPDTYISSTAMPIRDGSTVLPAQDNGCTCHVAVGSLAQAEQHNYFNNG